MVVTTALLVVLLTLAALYVLAPLVRDEDDLADLNRSRPGTRSLHGPNTEETRERRVVTLERGETQCSNCGAVVETGYNYCGECLTKVR
ncbi:MAG: hypothetical protein ACOCZD_00495 [Haloferacaceae archaeon]